MGRRRAGLRPTVEPLEERQVLSPAYVPVPVANTDPLALAGFFSKPDEGLFANALPVRVAFPKAKLDDKFFVTVTNFTSQSPADSLFVAAEYTDHGITHFHTLLIFTAAPLPDGASLPPSFINQDTNSDRFAGEDMVIEGLATGNAGNSKVVVYLSGQAKPRSPHRRGPARGRAHHIQRL
jgi:hypothetical protein